MAQHEYALTGEDVFFQVSPEASFWAEEPILGTVDIASVIERLGGEDRIAEYPREPTPDELNELAGFSYNRRYDDFSREQMAELGEFLTHPAFIARPPAGTVVNNRIRTGRLPIVRNGAELATMFEAEKTAVWHQHVLLTLLDLPGRIDGKTVRLREVISPVRQALMQAALHIASLSALNAAWRFKWRATPAASANNPKVPERRVARRERPAEHFKRIGKAFPVLYDSEVRFNADGDILRDVDRAPREPPNSPKQYPGTPRHPAYGSGHSTYSKAASDVLKAFLPRCWGMPGMPGGMIEDIHGSLDKLANSIGLARFWGGVHWPLDHQFGQTVGSAVAEILIEQLNNSLVDPRPSDFIKPPTRGELENLFEKTAATKRPRWDWAADGPFPDMDCSGDEPVARNANLQGPLV